MIVFQEQPDTGIRRMNAPVSVHTVTSKLRDSCHKTLPLELELPERGSDSPAGGAHSGVIRCPALGTSPKPRLFLMAKVRC